MKSIRILIAFIFGILTVSKAQEVQNPPVELRIVAVNATNHQITSTSNEVGLYLPMRIYIPTAFTPNGDGLNDQFGAVGEGIEVYKLKVFNRWGQIIFESESISNKWDGNYKGQLVPSGEYSYELLAYGKEVGEIFKYGKVLVIN